MPPYAGIGVGRQADRLSTLTHVGVAAVEEPTEQALALEFLERLGRLLRAAALLVQPQLELPPLGVQRVPLRLGLVLDTPRLLHGALVHGVQLLQRRGLVGELRAQLRRLVRRRQPFDPGDLEVLLPFAQLRLEVRLLGDGPVPRLLEVELCADQLLLQQHHALSQRVGGAAPCRVLALHADLHARTCAHLPR